MSRIFVSGLINLEVTLRVDSFPISYSPVRYSFHSVRTSVSGVGFNVAKALATLGDEVHFASMVGADFAGEFAKAALKGAGISPEYVVETMEQTPHSVILFDKEGRRQINVDLKDIQERVYPGDLFERASRGCSLLALCNINFSRPLLPQAKKSGRFVATDVHAISSIDDDYNRDFMAAADILFMSDESLPCPPEEWARTVVNRFGNEIVVVGLGAAGALLSVKRDNFLERVPAHPAPTTTNTIGAGDALFSAFLHFYARSHDPYAAIQKATIFAAHKIGETGAAEGFLTEDEVNDIHAGAH
jgi:sugar/nucleoside kinase (ribokinase family)